MGSVFSPYYAWARRWRAADPLDHCALNVALYGGTGKRWALTERGRSRVRRERSFLEIGPSWLAWQPDGLTVEIDEVTVPLPSRLRGRVRLVPEALTGRSFQLDSEGRHRWWPIAPCARVEVAFERPRLRWAGAAYFDSNWGDAPLADAFAHWHWSRAHLRDGATAVLYDVARRAGGDLSLALRCDRQGGVTPIPPPPATPLPPTGWRLARATRADLADARVRSTLEDTPFYARSLLESRILAESAPVVHESLSLDRFRQGWVQLLLPFRAPRWG